MKKKAKKRVIRIVKKAHKAVSLADKHAELFTPISPHLFDDLRQPDFAPTVNSVVSGGTAQAPIESWSNLYAKLG